MSGNSTTRRNILLTAGTVLTAGLAGCSTLQSTSDREPEHESDTVESERADLSTSERIYQQTIDSVVLIETDGQGTGFVYDKEHVVTNAHVTGSVTEAEVRFNEGGWSTAEVIGTDVHSDLAVLSVAEIPDVAEPLSFTDDPVRVGKKVLAIGNPYSLNGTMTSGIVSGVDRSIPSPSGFEIPNAIQTDAPVNPGNSGGPLVNADGEVVAVINSGGGDNIGFGISAALTQRVVPRLIETGKYDHSYLGIGFATVTPAIAEANGFSQARGLQVVRIDDGGPSDGILQPSTEVEYVGGQRVRSGGDIILSIDNQSLMTGEDLGSYLALQTRPGDTVELRIIRDGAEQRVQVELGTRPEQVQS